MDAVDSTRPQHYHQQPQSQQRKRVKTGTWLPVEDERLRMAVAKHGTRWVSVAGEVGTRNGDQCAKRWSENLNPELDHSPWTQEEVSRVEFRQTKVRLLSHHPIIPCVATTAHVQAVLQSNAFRISGTQTTSFTCHTFPSVQHMIRLA
jgi:hypothetical protein